MRGNPGVIRRLEKKVAAPVRGGRKPQVSAREGPKESVAEFGIEGFLGA